MGLGGRGRSARARPRCRGHDAREPDAVLPADADGR
jgi:hypothetical protein